jgi:hypothetical protein
VPIRDFELASAQFLQPATRDKFFHNCGEPIRENMPEFTASESDEESDHGHDDDEEEEGARGEGGADGMYWLDGVSALRTQRRLLLRELQDRGCMYTPILLSVCSKRGLQPSAIMLKPQRIIAHGIAFGWPWHEMRAVQCCFVGGVLGALALVERSI